MTEYRMMPHKMTTGMIEEFAASLRHRECSKGTIAKYLRDIRRFAEWGNRCSAKAGSPQEDPLITKETVLTWKEELIRQNYAPTTVNSMLAAMNSFFRFAGWTDCKVKALKVQRKIFRDASKNLRKEEYERLVKAAKDSDKEWLALLMETICATGIRVSEVRYITVEAAMAGRTDVRLKGKIRTILLPGKLCKKLKKYAKKEHLVSGEIFITERGTSLSRGRIWSEMKSLCHLAGVEPSKVFPHNLRHLFARTFFKSCKDIVKLADLMGHSSVETTRIYLISTGEEHERFLNRMQLIS